MTTTVSFKPLSAGSGEANFTKTGAATCHAALNDNSDASFIKRVSTTTEAAVFMRVDTSVVPAGKNLNRWKVRLRNNRPASGTPYITAGAYWLAATGTSVRSWGSLHVYGQIGAIQWDESGYFSAATADFLTDLPADNYLGIVADDSAPTSGARSNLYEAWIEAEYVDPPTCTVTAPTGTITDSNYPTIAWTFATTEANPQSLAVVKIFDAATYGAAGFSPATATPLWEKTIVGSAASVTVDTPLPPAGSYRAYVLVSENTGYITSPAAAYAFSSFTLALTPPPLPTVDGAYVLATNSVSLITRGHHNLLTAEQASLEGATTTGWAVGTNCAITNSTTQALHGTHSLRLSSSGAGDMYATTLTGLSAVPVLAGEVYSAVADFRSAVSVRSCRVDIAWYDASGAFISASSGVAANDATGAWSCTPNVIGTAPATAAFAAVRCYVLAAGGASELHYVDKVSLYPGIAASSVNLLGNPSAETNVDGWQPVGASPVTIARSTVRANHGAASFLFTSTSTVQGDGGFYARGLTPGQWYDISAYIYITTADACPSIRMQTTDCAVNDLKNLSTKDAWTRVTLRVQAALATHFVVISGLFTGSGQKFWVDSAQVEVMSVSSPTAFSVPTATWTLGGYAQPSIILERSNDNGLTWVVVRRTILDTPLNGGVSVTTNLQQYATADYEAARPGSVLYRAQAVGVINGVIVSSGYTANDTVVTTSDGRAWLKAVEQPTLNTQVWARRGSDDESVDEDVAVHHPLGLEGAAIVVAGDIGGPDGVLTLLAKTDAEYDAARALMVYQGRLLYQSTEVDSTGRGRQRWIRISGRRDFPRLSNPRFKELTAPFVYVGPGTS